MVSYQVPSNKNASAPPQAPKFSGDQADQLRLREIRLSAEAHALADEVGQGGLGAAEVTLGPMQRVLPGSSFPRKRESSVVRQGHWFLPSRRRRTLLGGPLPRRRLRRSIWHRPRAIARPLLSRRSRWRHSLSHHGCRWRSVGSHARVFRSNVAVAGCRGGGRGVALRMVGPRHGRRLRGRAGGGVGLRRRVRRRPQWASVRHRRRARPERAHRLPGSRLADSACSRRRDGRDDCRRDRRAARRLHFLSGSFARSSPAVLDPQGTCPGAGRCAAADADIWGLGCFGGGTRCGVRDQLGITRRDRRPLSTLLGLRARVVVQRGGQRYAGLLKLMSILRSSHRHSSLRLRWSCCSGERAWSPAARCRVRVFRARAGSMGSLAWRSRS